MKWIFSIILIIFFFPAVSQIVAVTGLVKDSHGQPVGYAGVQYKNGGTSADKNGEFSLDLDSGSYEFTVSAIGFQKRKVIIHVPMSSLITITLEEDIRKLSEVVVTATRTNRNPENVPVPLDIIPKDKVEKIGALRLNDVLLEETGLQLISDHGTGLQMQGLSSDYILFLIDGEPLIGRTAGTFELNRLSVDNIERVEIIKGPSSSLYGSEAMAGVVNIITRQPERGMNVSIRSRFRSHSTSDLSGTVGYRNDRLKVSVFADRLSTSGYDLNKENGSMTAPPYQSYTFQPKFSYRFSDKVKFHLNTRFYKEDHKNTSEVEEDKEVVNINESARQSDWNLMPSLAIHVNDQHQIQLRNYTSGYKTNTLMEYSNGDLYDKSYFNQFFNRSEIQYDWYLNDSQIATFGVGHTIETVEATRYNEVNDFQANYGFAQFQWDIGTSFNLIAGGRFDAHSEYASRFSPKLALGYKINDHLKVQASIGGGYKAPDFRQLLLNFTNPVAGYTVAGSSIVNEVMKQLKAEDQIATIIIDPETIQTIEAESSLAFNAGLHWDPYSNLSFHINGFRNNIKNLIDSAPIARKTNGQNVFSYFNFDEVVTQGFEVKSSYDPLEDLQFSIGYQYLDSRNVEDIKKLKNGEIFRRDPETNATEVVRLSEYGGLPNRSRHSGNAKVFYINTQYKFNVGFRTVYRGKWGLGDTNGNGIIDAGNEFSKGYLLFNLSVNKSLFGWLTLEMGSNNLTNVTNVNEPALSGRIWYAGMNLNLNQLFTTTNH